MSKSSIAALPETYSNGYISLPAFREQMSCQIECPYETRFSFLKLIEALRNKNAEVKEGGLKETINYLEALEDRLQNDNSSWKELQESEAFQPLMKQIFPSFFPLEQLGFINGPLENHEFRFATPDFKNLLDNDNLEIKLDPNELVNPVDKNILLAGLIILIVCYDQDINITTREIMAFRDCKSKMEKHYRINIQPDYLEVKLLKPLKKLGKKQIHELLSNLRDIELWKKHLPPENFLFEGFVIGTLTDMTKAEILSTLKEMAANEGGKSGHENDLNYMEVLVRSYLDMPEISLGTLQTVYGPWMENLTWCLLRKFEPFMMLPALKEKNSAYGKLLDSGEAVIIEDLKKHKQLNELEQKLRDVGYRSLLLVPLFDTNGNIVSIFELASPEPYRFNQLTLVQLNDFISLFEMGTNKFLQEMDNSVRLTIQQEFTSIHPSVEWKFRKVASQYFWERSIQQEESIPEPIVFKNVYPLYGQADIVSSSKHRNNSIEADLIDNLQRIAKLLAACRKTIDFHLLELYLGKVNAHLSRLEEGAFVSSDESVIVELLIDQIHPMLRKLRLSFPQLPQKELDAYFAYLDPELDIVYRQRKDYEDSVSLINQIISYYLLAEEEKMQGVLPHYFEKFQTDGVEYNLYLGQSLLEKGTFHDFYLRDFRLWQLISMCEITRLVKRKAKTFPVPLETAQLIFIFNSSLSIRFQMDEKQFDVDGAYNVRYEILKKRIDKAYIKGTDERLTQAGKIAIVWLQEKDRQEYQEYLDYLIDNGYISPDVEDLELERMQGVEGLKAIRLNVIGEEY